MQIPIRDSKSAVVAANGTASVEFRPNVMGEFWQVSTVGITATAGNPGAAFKSYINSVFVGGSYSVELDADPSFNQLVAYGDSLYGRWEGMTPGTNVVMSIVGTKTTVDR